MKKIACNILLAGLASLLVAHAQTNATLDSQPVDTNNPSNIVIVATTNNVATETTNQIPPTVVITNATVVILEAAATNSVPVAGSPAPAAEAGIGIPLIQFSDTALTVAIESLARRAGINYMLDPKIGFGQPDASGQVRVDPTLSIRWENISAENALLALLDNYNLQLIRDKKTGIDRVTPKDPLALPPLITRVIQLKNSSTSNMVDSVQAALTDKRSKVLADNRTSQLIVVATDPEQLSVDTLVNQLDKPTRQVLIETKLVEISSQPKTAKGVDWTGTLQAQHVAFGNGIIDPTASLTKVTTPGNTTVGTPTPGGGYTPTTTASSSQSSILNLIQGSGGFSASTVSGLIPETGFLSADGVKAVLSFLNSAYDAQIVSTPRIVTLDNETATLEVTRQYPVINFGGGTQNSSGSSSVTYSNVGTMLQVTPRISANDSIWLKIVPEVSSHFADQNITIPGGNGNPSFSFTVPIFDVRKMNTQVLIPNGSTLVMGGLVQDSPTATYTKVPFLGDIPGLGWAFRSENKSMNKDNLIIFLTPTIVKDTDFHPTETDFLQSKPKTMKSPMDPNTMWDSAQPRGNWSNPAPVPGEFDGKGNLNNF
jgi:type II secretory pathway component GspD/PulD (secretin)